MEIVIFMKNGNLIKNLYLYIFFFLSFFVNGQDNEIIEGKFKLADTSLLNDEWVLELPYEIENNIEVVFQEDTAFAIDFIQIMADGEELDVSGTSGALVKFKTYYKLKDVEKGKNNYYILMKWYRGGESLRWSDHGGNPVHSRSYEVLKSTKTLEIVYRIILPYTLLTFDNLFDKNYKEKMYTKEYRIRINNINEVFEYNEPDYFQKKKEKQFKMLLVIVPCVFLSVLILLILLVIQLIKSKKMQSWLRKSA
jgi:hypothetical protein